MLRRKSVAAAETLVQLPARSSPQQPPSCSCAHLPGEHHRPVGLGKEALEAMPDAQNVSLAHPIVQRLQGKMSMVVGGSDCWKK